MRRRAHSPGLEFLAMRRMLSVLTVLLASFSFAASAFSQTHYDAQGLPTNVPQLQTQRPLKAWGIAGLALILCIAVGFKSSRRVHGE